MKGFWERQGCSAFRNSGKRLALSLSSFCRTPRQVRCFSRVTSSFTFSVSRPRSQPCQEKTQGQKTSTSSRNLSRAAQDLQVFQIWLAPKCTKLLRDVVGIFNQVFHLVPGLVLLLGRSTGISFWHRSSRKSPHSSSLSGLSTASLRRPIGNSTGLQSGRGSRLNEPPCKFLSAARPVDLSLSFLTENKKGE